MCLVSNNLVADACASRVMVQNNLRRRGNLSLGSTAGLFVSDGGFDCYSARFECLRNWWTGLVIDINATSLSITDLQDRKRLDAGAGGKAVHVIITVSGGYPTR